jgi:integrase/recombinase XerD
MTGDTTDAMTNADGSSGVALRQGLEDYLQVRRALGFKLAAVGRLLGQFVDWSAAGDTPAVTTRAAVEWARLPATASRDWHGIRYAAVRGFAVFLHAADPSVEVPPAGLLRVGPCRVVPFLYSPEEITALITAAGHLRPRLRAATYQTLIGLLATTGIRIGEAIAADVADLDVDRRVLLVRHAKFDQSRLVPLHPSTVAALTGYLDLRDRLQPAPACPALFTSTRATRLLHSNIGLTFNRLTQAAGITARSPSCRPRIHDLRHSFAVATVLDWYRTGADVAAMLPRLSTVLGHTDPQHTYWYLEAAPELMAVAGQRLDAYLTACRSPRQTPPADKVAGREQGRP